MPGMVLRRPVAPEPTDLFIVAAERTFSATGAVQTITTSTTYTVSLPEGTRVGDLLLLNAVQGITTGSTLNPTVPSGFTQLRTYSPANSGWHNRVSWAVATQAMINNGFITIPANSAASTTGGYQAHIIVLRNQRATTPIVVTAGGTGMPNMNAATSIPFATYTPPGVKHGVFWFGGAYRSSANTNDGSWSAAAPELLDTGGPRCNTSNGTANAYSAGSIRNTATATGAVTLTFNSQQARDGCRVVVAPAA